MKSTSLSTHDKQMNNYDMRTASPRPRLTTIDEGIVLFNKYFLNFILQSKHFFFNRKSKIQK